MKMLRFYHNKPIWLISFMLWSLFIILASVLPDSRQVIKESTVSFRWDYLAHFLAYFAFGTFYILWRGDSEYSIRGRELLILFAATCSFAVLTEYMQLFIPGRAFNLIDIIYNLAGVLGSILLVYLCLIRYYFRRKLTAFKAE